MTVPADPAPLLAAVLAAVAVAGLLPASPRTLPFGPPGSRPGRAARRRPAPTVLAVAGAAATVVVVAGSRPAPTVLPLTATAVVVATTGAVLLRRSHAAALARRRRSAVIEACDALAAGLRAGQPPQQVLERAAADVSLLGPVATAARLGGDVAGALRSAARVDGGEGLALVAAAWTVAQRSGAGLAGVVARIAGTVRAEADQRRQVEVALGTSRSTARLLAGLPVLGVGLGTGIDADPLGVLLGSAVGAWCLLLGVTLGAAGLLWVERLADAALR